MNSSRTAEIWTGREDRTAFRLDEWPWRPPSNECLEALLDPEWSQVRTAELGRPFWSYRVSNLSCGRSYQTELFVGIDGVLRACCDCPATIPCKHVATALIDLWIVEPSAILVASRSPYFDGLMDYIAALDAIVREYTDRSLSEIRSQ